MSALTEIASYLIQTFLGLLLLVTLMRLVLQISKADFYNPISQAFVKLTNPPLLPLRKLMPNFEFLDLSCLVLALSLQTGLIALLLTVNGMSMPNISVLLIWAFLGVAGLLVKIYFFTLLIMIVLSWIAPNSFHPAIQLIHQIIEPVVTPFRRLLPPIGGLDFSPILVFIFINILEILLRHFAVSIGLHPALVMGI